MPEEDPGIVVITLQRDGEYESAHLSGPDITKDPRTLDLEAGVDDLVAVLSDPRFGLTTTKATAASYVKRFPH